MAPISRIVFWQPIASPHQEAFLEALARQFDGELILGVERSLPADRQAQGWKMPSHTSVKVIDISVPANHAALAAHATAATLHVFSGFFSHRLVWAGFRKLASSSAQLAIYSEAPEQPWATGWIKRLRGRVLAARWARRFAFVLAIGGVGCDFFQRIGFPEDRIVPFGYYVDVLPLADTSEASPSGGDDVRFISAGQLIRRKGVDLLVRACGDLPATGWRLDIYGDGPERQSLERLVRAAALADRIVFRGVVPNGAVRAVLGRADLAVLPSRFDGWGMLVTESLAEGTPVICTDACGVASLVTDDQVGRVVPAGQIAPLSSALSLVLAGGRVTGAARAAVRESVSRNSRLPLAVARFLNLLPRA